VEHVLESIGSNLIDWNVVRDKELHRPMRAWLRDAGLLPVPRPLLYTYQSCGYGYLDDEIPAIYFIRLFLSCIGRPKVVKAGAETIWVRLAEQLMGSGVSVRTNAAVHTVRRDSGIEIQMSSGRAESFDALIWAAGPQAALGALDLDSESRRDLQGMLYHDYLASLVEAEGLPDRPAQLVNVEAHQTRDSAGHVNSFFRPSEKRPLYLLWQYAGGRTDDELQQLALDDLTSLGAVSPRVLAKKRWGDFFPHFTPNALKDGVPQNLERREAGRKTYFVGAMMSLEIIEWVVAQSQDLVSRVF
jgi:hypothetical protein